MMSSLSAMLSLAQIGTLGYWIIFLLSFAESLAFVGLFIPGTAVIILAGGLAAHGIENFRSLLVVATAGAILGDALSYELGRRSKRSIERSARLRGYVERAQPFFEQHGGKSVFLGRFLGHIRPIVPVIAGMAHMPRIRFYIANILSAFGWSLTYLSLGYLFETAWKVALVGFGRIALVLLIPLVLLALLLWLWQWILGHGEGLLRILLSLLNSVRTGFLENEYVHAWVERHPKSTGFLQNRFSGEHFQGLPLTLLALATLSTFSIFSGIVEDYLTNDTLVALDTRLAHLFFAFRSPALLQFFYGVTALVDSISILLASAVLTVVLFAQHRRIHVLVLWLTLIGSEGMATLGKILFHRPRPSGLIPVLSEHSYSFPSGHATSAVVLFGFLAYLLIREHRSWKIKVSAFFTAVLLVFLVDLSRLYLGVHFVSDVLAGNTLALTVLLFAIAVGEWLRSSLRETRALFSWKPIIAALALEGVYVTGFLLFTPLAQQSVEQLAPLTHVSPEHIPPLFEEKLLPRYTETLIGTPQEPANLLLIIPDQCLIASLRKASWLEADPPSTETVWKLAKSALLNTEYLTAPMTPSFYDTQPHTIGFEKGTEQRSVRSRHHARFWRTDYATNAGTLYVGTVSLDTGLKWWITHKIAPDIDTERDLFLADLIEAKVVARSAFLPLVPPTLGKNFSGDQFFTNGKAALVTLRDCR